MSAGVLLITHGALGEVLLQTARYMLGELPERAEALAVDSDRAPEEIEEEARGCIDRLDRGDGVIVLTDLTGATPANVAGRLLGRGNVVVVCGVNLAMLVKTLSYRHLPLEQLADKAVQGGRDGIVRQQ